MNKCPQCNNALTLKLMKTITVNSDGDTKRTNNAALVCPECGALLKSTPHPFDKKIQNYLLWPAILLPFGMLFKQEWLFYLTGFIFIITIAYVIKRITGPEYKAWNVWSLYN